MAVKCTISLNVLRKDKVAGGQQRVCCWSVVRYRIVTTVLWDTGLSQQCCEIHSHHNCVVRYIRFGKILPRSPINDLIFIYLVGWVLSFWFSLAACLTKSSTSSRSQCLCMYTWEVCTLVRPHSHSILKALSAVIPSHLKFSSPLSLEVFHYLIIWCFHLYYSERLFNAYPANLENIVSS